MKLIEDFNNTALVHTYYNRLKCNAIQSKVDREAGNIDFYNIYGPVCSHSSNASRKTKHTCVYDPCELSYARNYLNLPRVQEALHANITNLPYSWDACRFNLLLDRLFLFFIDTSSNVNLFFTFTFSAMVNEYWTDSPSSMFPVYKRLISFGLRILLYR